uniref:tRNA (N(6)-L-threonylcarbamoyladenosine(37)-C(2))- methylthiotransferase MtaB n=1 Tax=Helicobacter sp. 15-1451 TaxID=2004995 RepID=UPI0026D04364
MSVQKVFFKTFGCRTNVFDTEIMRSCLRDFSVTQQEEQADIVVVNSCTVTNGADSSVRSYIRRLNAIGKKVYLSGCGVHTQGERLYNDGLVFGVFSHAFREKINDILMQEQRIFECKENELVDSKIVPEVIGKSRAFIKIQEGCDFSCSYCIIPSVRGRARSQSKEKIYEQIALLCDIGFTEFVLTGTNMGSYGKGLGDIFSDSLATLIKNISKIQGVRRIRLGSLEPSQIDAEFKELLGEPFMAKHLHIALQHTDDEMLKIMNRKNYFMQDLELFEEIADKGYALGTDYIIAHPGESQERFEKGFKRLEQLPLTHIHPFIYSKRDNTVSAKFMQETKGDEAKQRLKRVNDLIAQKNYAFRKNIQNQKIPLQILIENSSQQCLSGLDQYYNRMVLENGVMGFWVELTNYQVEDKNNYGKI